MLITGIAIVLVAVNGIPIIPKAFGWGMACLVAGALMPFIVKGRHRLAMKTTSGTIKWTPSLVLDRPYKEKIWEIFNKISRSAKTSGIIVEDQRHEHHSRNIQR